MSPLEARFDRLWELLELLVARVYYVPLAEEGYYERRYVRLTEFVVALNAFVSPMAYTFCLRHADPCGPLERRTAYAIVPPLLHLLEQHMVTDDKPRTAKWRFRAAAILADLRTSV